jgi:Flp pilus assembly protein TadG
MHHSETGINDVETVMAESLAISVRHSTCFTDPSLSHSYTEQSQNSVCLRRRMAKMAPQKITPAQLLLRRLKTIRRNDDGSTAIEFALVSMPFLALMFGIMSISLVFFWIFTMENAVWAASRDLRTGAFQNPVVGSRYYGLSTDQKKDQFKLAVCERAAVKSDCMAGSRILVQARTTFGGGSGIQAPNCLKADNSLVDETAAWAAFDAGAASSVVMVTVCYSWAFGGKLPFLHLKTIADGSYLIQASSAFRTEPYN